MDAGSEVGGCCALCCTGIFQQFFNTRTWGSNWTCLDKCCRCECCWDAGEFDPNDRPGPANTKKEEDKAPPAYQKADPMTIGSQQESQQTKTFEQSTDTAPRTSNVPDQTSQIQP